MGVVAKQIVFLKFEDLHENLKFEIDFTQFFKYYKVRNAKFLAEKILTGIHQIGQELSEMNLIYKR